MTDDFITSLKSQGKSLATIKTYNLQLKKFFLWLETKEYSSNPQDITSFDLVDYRNYLQEQNALPSSINTALAVIKSFYQWAKEEGYVTNNPAGRVKRVEQVVAPPKWLERSEKARLIRTVENEKDIRNIVIVLVLLLAGLRASELCDLKHDDIILSERKGEIVIRKGKGNKRRVVPIEKDLRYWLGKYITEDHIAGEWLFDSQRGEKLTYFGVYRLCETIGIKAKIKGLTPHVLRHTYGHDLASKGVPVQIIATLMGHSKIETTRIYVTPGRNELQSAVDKLSYT